MRYPKALREQGTIGVTAPSFGCVTEPYKSAFVSAQRQLAQRGFSVKVGETCGLAEGIGISSTPQRCARELTQFMTDPACDVVLSAGGGEMMCEVISRMDFDALAAADPKWFMGFSDNTNMTYLLATACDTASVYGPNAPAFGMKPWHPVLDQALELLMGTRDRVTGFDLWEKEGRRTDRWWSAGCRMNLSDFRDACLEDVWTAWRIWQVPDGTILQNLWSVIREKR